MLKINKLFMLVPMLFVIVTVQAGQDQQAVKGATVSGYLGMRIDSVPAPVRAHYPKDVDPASGVIVTEFADKSPAADYGIKMHDVLISYDEEAIKDPQSLINKIRDDKPGREAQLQVFRQGELLTVPVIIGQQAVVAVQNQQQVAPPPMPYQMSGQRPQPPHPVMNPMGGVFPPANMPRNYYSITPPVNTSNPAAMNAPAAMPTIPGQPPAVGTAPPAANYNGLAIRRIGENIYDASIGFVAPDGSQQRRSYKGTREQIMQQIMNARDLPAAERQQLLFAVMPRKQKSTGWGGMPFGDSDMFNPGKFFKGWGW